MEKEPVYIPPIMLENIEDFKEFARNAKIVVYNIERFSGPFKDSNDLIRRIHLYAVGVPVRGMPLTFEIEVSWNDIANPNIPWHEQSGFIESTFAEILQEISAFAPMVPGRLELQNTLPQVYA